MPEIELCLSTPDESYVIKNLWPLYQHDVSRFDGAAPKKQGVFSDDEKMTTLSECGETLGSWWDSPGSLFPYLMRVDSSPVGFNLIAASASLPASIRADFVVHEFFVVHAWRGRSVAEKAAVEGFERHKGVWEVVTYPTHSRAITFWRIIIGRYTSMRFSEQELDHAWGRKVAFRFDNA
ncbi:GNAT family N-acetyltransferase [Botrimarina hoheduenensis]|uniref:N-acetyltransferase domain-containing protein n=1 Tax=Botrimarina hoheduenensis TaxID=2528000 RepID=A0A5C5VXW7_9BACT|nr:GNAT family N-acetyltransferase [Botrimarina hoheduenensis]TWT43284.1 hypothetical protein Pla111_22350 [Botrimarina hoheduenensis]